MRNLVPRRGLKLARISGIDVLLHPSWFIIFVILIYSIATYLAWEEAKNPIDFLLISALTATMLFASLLCHELAHAIVAKRNGVMVKKITLFIFGGVAQMEEDVSKPFAEMRMAAAGPALSLALGFVFIVLSGAGTLENSQAISDSLYLLGVVNMAICAFNMVPAFPMDGGRILRAALWGIWKDKTRATNVASRMGIGFGWTLAGSGFAFILISGIKGFMETLLSGAWLILIGFYIVGVARRSYQHQVMADEAEELTANDAMERFPFTVNCEMTVKEAMSEMRRLGDDSILPITKAGRINSWMRAGDSKHFVMEGKGDMKVGNLAPEVHGQMLVKPEELLKNALNKMSSNNVDLIWVVDEKERPLGYLRSDHTAEYLFSRARARLSEENREDDLLKKE